MNRFFVDTNDAQRVHGISELLVEATAMPRPEGGWVVTVKRGPAATVLQSTDYATRQLAFYGLCEALGTLDAG